MPEPRQSDAIIAIVDDDPSARQGLQRLVRSVGDVPPAVEIQRRLS